MCGAVQITLPALPATYATCACDMCRRITGGVFYSVWVDQSDMTLTGEASVRTCDSSPWAERGFCGACGSPLWYRHKEGDQRGLALGLFDDTSGLTAGDLYYSDKQICETLRQIPANPMTEAETHARFAGGDA
jgi:hypothetical protein